MAINQDFVFAVYDGSTGTPKTGYAASLSFFVYENEVGTPLSRPTIFEVGNGLYKFTPSFTPNHLVCFILDTAGANPTYIFGSLRAEDYGTTGPSPQVVVFPIYDAATGIPKTGVVPTFSAYEDVNGTPLTPPALSEVGGGLYKFAPTFTNGTPIAYVIGTGQLPPRHSGFVRAEDFLLSGFIAVGASASPQQVTVSFVTGYVLDALSGTAANPASWVISGPTTVTVTAVNLIGNQVVLTTTPMQSGGSYTLTLPTSGITATGGSYTLLGPPTLPFTGAAGDPVLLQANSVDEKTVDLTFSFAPTASRALDVTQYSIPGLTVLGVTARSASVYRLTTSNQTIGTTYTITWPLH